MPSMCNKPAGYVCPVVQILRGAKPTCGPHGASADRDVHTIFVTTPQKTRFNLSEVIHIPRIFEIKKINRKNT